MGPSKDLSVSSSPPVLSPGTNSSPALWLSKILSANLLSFSGSGLSVMIKNMSNLLSKDIGILT